MTSPLRIALPLALLSAAASPAIARSGETTRLVSCAAGDCLLVRGHRLSREAEVRINGHAVAVAGGRAWRVALPVATVRDWSPSRARTLDVAVIEPGADAARATTMRLPVGMFTPPVELRR